jgi:hypothetical protein
MKKIKLTDIRNNFGDDIKKIARRIEFENNISLSHLCDNINFNMCIDGEQITFIYMKNYTKIEPELFVEYNNESHQFEYVEVYPEQEPAISIKYKCPYYEQTIPAKMVASKYDIFKVYEYDMIPETTIRKLNYDAVENLIYDALIKLKICE